MNNIMITVLLSNMIIIIYTIIQNVYNNYENKKKYKSIDQLVSKSLNNMNKKAKEEYDSYLLKNNKDEIQKEEYDMLYYNNHKMIMNTMNMSYYLFSQIFNDKKLYCSLRIHKEENIFQTIAHIKSNENIQYNAIFDIDKNTDLINIFDYRYSIFAISNINDYKKINRFMLQDNELRKNTKAIISIALKKQKKIIGCYSVYFSKPLNDIIEISKLENVFLSFSESLSDLINTYIENKEK